MRIRNAFGTGFRGTIGKDMVASSWNGHDYLREYVIPHDPKTERQLRQRGLFRDAVAAWHRLVADEQEEWDRDAVGMTGFNRFVSRYLRERRRHAQDAPKPRGP